MDVPMLDAPQALIDERRRLGLDGRDEMWDGVLHMVPPPKDVHQGLSMEFALVVAPIAKRLGLVPRMETGLFASDTDFRVPDQLYRRTDQGSERGAEAAELVVEVRSEGDETYRKFPFYAARGVREVLVLHPAPRRVELFRLVDGELRPISARADGGLRSDVLEIDLKVAADCLTITWSEGSADI